MGCSTLASAITCFVSFPFEMAHKAFLADSKWPSHLRRGYTSSFDALIKIPQ